MKTLQDLFFNELADCYDAECRLTRALPGMAGNATHRNLKKAFELQLKEAEGHVRKIQNVFECFDRKPRWKTCEVVMGMLRECDDMVAAFEGSPAVDAVLIVAIERIAHYQMASDRCLQEWALQLGNKKAAALLAEVLKEVEVASKAFTALARSIRHESAPANPSVAGVRRLRRASAAH